MTAVAPGERSVVTVGASRAAALRVLLRSGLLGPGRPDRMVRRAGALARFGPTLAGSFAAATARDPGRTALVDETRRLTYAEVDARVRRIGAGLVERGAGPGATVATLQRNSVAAVEAMVAISRTGSNALLLNTFLSPPQIAAILGREQPVIVVVDADLRDQVGDPPAGVAVLATDDLADSSAPEPAVPERPGRVVLLTSGTTGTPKGANRGAPRGLGPAASMLSRIPLRAPETMLIAPPVFHTLGLGLLQLAPALNSTIVLRRAPDAEGVLGALAAERCTSAVLVPVMAQRLVDLPAAVRAGFDTSALRVAVCGSAALTPDVGSRFLDAFGEVLHNIYGTTECSWATIATPAELRRAPGTVGRPPMGTRLALLGDDGEPVPRGEVGQIHVGNQMVFDGYTAGGGPARVGGLVATGDLGSLTADGLLTVLGRDDDMVVVGGENIHPIEVEALLGARPEVAEVAVVGVPDERLGQRLVAYVVPAEGHDLGADDVKELVRGRLSRYSVPRDVVLLPALPRNAVGKVVPRLLPPPEGRTPGA